MEQKTLNVLVGLDLSEMDRELIKYIGTLQEWLPPARVTFLHNIKITELPRHMQEPARLQNIAQRIEQKFRETIEAIHIPAAPYDIRVTFEGFSELAFTTVAKQTKAGLVLLGNKQTLEGSGGLNQKLARMLPAAILLIPEGTTAVPRRVMQAIDFSRYTPAVVQWGRVIAGNSTTASLHPVYISKMAYHFFPVFSDEEMEEALQKEAAERAKKWKEQYPAEAPLKVVPAHDKNVAAALFQYAFATRADVLVLGVKGASSLTNLFMGSVANEIIQRETSLCLLLVKPV